MYRFDVPSPAKVIREEDALVILWEDGEQDVFPHDWLRENSPESRLFSATGRPETCSSPQDHASPWSVYIEYDETLVISWAGLRDVSRFDLDELRDAAAAFESPELALAAD